MIVLYIFILLLSFYLLAQVSDKYFIPALDDIAKELKLSNDMAGATLMAIGSSAPELFVAIISIIKPGNHIEIGIGTIVGSAVFNILVIIGAIAVIRTSIINWQTVFRDTLFYSASVLLLLWSFYDGRITLVESVIFIAIYLLYVFMVLKWRKIFKYKEFRDEDNSKGQDEIEHKWRLIFKPFDFLLNKFFPRQRHYYINFFISILFIGLLCWVLVESAVKISGILHIPEVFIALIVLAAGTSVPDLMSSVIVARQGRGGMAISNAIGSNIFDILIGLGLPWLVILTFSRDYIVVSRQDMLSSVLLLLGSVITVFVILAIQKWKTTHRAGYFLIILYIIFLVLELLKI